jgi:hypothetical protein
VPVKDLDEIAGQLSAQILRERLLPRLQHDLPGVAEEMLGKNMDNLVQSKLTFSGKYLHMHFCSSAPSL